MTFLGIKRKICFLLINGVFSGTHFFEIKRKLLIYAGYHIGEKSKIIGPIQITTELSIGKDCWIGMDFLCSGNGKVTIGNRCDIAPQVTIVTGSHEIGDIGRRAGKGRNDDVTIGEGCWLCARATVIGGVNISNSCIVASCACVVASVDNNNMVGGVPARKIADLPK